MKMIRQSESYMVEEAVTESIMRGSKESDWHQYYSADKENISH